MQPEPQPETVVEEVPEIAEESENPPSAPPQPELMLPTPSALSEEPTSPGALAREPSPGAIEMTPAPAPAPEPMELSQPLLVSLDAVTVEEAEEPPPAPPAPAPAPSEPSRASAEEELDWDDYWPYDEENQRRRRVLGGALAGTAGLVLAALLRGRAAKRAEPCLDAGRRRIPGKQGVGHEIATRHS